MLVHGKIFSLDVPVVMGIINATPDSFVASTRTLNSADISRRAEKLLADGAAILDVGAYSTRPGCADVSPEEEMSRLDIALRAVAEVSRDAVVSVDTFRASVARRVVEEFGVSIINDVSGGADPEMFPTVARLHVPYVLSHIKGTVRTMKEECLYSDLLPEMMRYFAEKLQELHLLGVSDVIIDPGFGFSKTTEQSLEVLANLSVFSTLGCPILAGISRKSMLSQTLGIVPEDALNATTAANMLALQGGASILRVHDAKEAVEAVKIFTATKKFQTKNSIYSPDQCQCSASA